MQLGRQSACNEGGRHRDGTLHVAGGHLHAIREAISIQLGRHRDGMLRVAEERATPVEVEHVVQGDDEREAALVIMPAKPRLLSWTRRVPDEGGHQT